MALLLPVLAAMIFIAAAVVRVTTLERQGLWADEVFSLAMATGHSLEHSAAAANPSLGDFAEQPLPLPAQAFHAYLQHETPAAGPARVVRAVLLSDTSPPLYYLLLHGWTRWTGTSDAALRLFSVLWALACLPLLWSIGRRFGGRSAAVVACTLFAFAPVAIRYSTEGRMYSLVWFLVLLTAWLALRLQRQGFHLPTLLGWVAVSAAGLLTHYFYAFAWFGIWVWLLCFPGRLDRRSATLSAVGVGLLVLPWYALLPESLGAWRVTQDWLTVRPPAYSPLRAPVDLAWSFFSAEPWQSRQVVGKRIILLFLLFGAVLLWRLDWRRRGRHALLLFLWIAAVCLGPVLFDLLRGTYASSLYRYGLAGLPAAFLLLALVLSRTPRPVQALALVAILWLWTPGIRELYTHPARSGSPYREAAQKLSTSAGASDLILLHSIPSGVVGVARYLDSPAVIAPWVGQLGQRRVPEDLQTLATGQRRIFLVKISAVGAPAPQEAYLRTHASVLSETRLMSSELIEFAPLDGGVFFPDHPTDGGTRLTSSGAPRGATTKNGGSGGSDVPGDAAAPRGMR